VVLVLAAFVIGGIVGIALGGRPANLGGVHYRWWPLAIAGLLLQVVPVPHGWTHVRGYGATLLVASFVLLLVFVVANLRSPGFPLIAIGLVLNATVITVNSGMPVTATALRAASDGRMAEAIARLETEGGAKHHLAGPSDELLPLADNLGIGAPIRGVFSVGDVLWIAGAAWAVAGGMLLKPTADPASGEPVPQPAQPGDPPVRVPDSESLSRDPAPAGGRRPPDERRDPAGA
jgi:Family of unknown function (DUF5317)